MVDVSANKSNLVFILQINICGCKGTTKKTTLQYSKISKKKMQTSFTAYLHYFVLFMIYSKEVYPI